MRGCCGHIVLAVQTVTVINSRMRDFYPETVKWCLHDTTRRTAECTTGCTTGCIVYTQLESRSCVGRLQQMTGALNCLDERISICLRQRSTCSSRLSINKRPTSKSTSVAYLEGRGGRGPQTRGIKYFE